MAHDFILGDTGTNWSRGFSVLLPQTPDSSSMEEKTATEDATQISDDKDMAQAEGFAKTGCSWIQTNEEGIPMRVQIEGNHLRDGDELLEREDRDCPMIGHYSVLNPFSWWDAQTDVEDRKMRETAHQSSIDDKRMGI